MSIVSKNINKTYKNINLFLSFIINFLFLILINTIGNDEIDILSQTSMYTNNYFVSLIELTTSLFILWLMILLLISIIKSILSLIDNKKLELEPVKVINPTLNTIELDFNNNNDDLEGVETHPINPDSNTVMIINDIDSKQADDDINVEINKNIPADKVVNQGFDFNDFIKKDNILLDELKTNKTGLDKLMSIKPIKPVEDNNYVNLNPNTINNNFINPVLEENDSRLDIEKIIPSINVSNENETERVKDKYTKEDYKLFYDILNQVRANNDGKSIVTMDDALSVNLLNKFSIKQYNLYKKMLEDIRGC
jgi:hypothetical protein